MESLVNSVKCAEIVSKELGRSVKREYISRLASEQKIPYHLVDGKKMYYPSEVMASLPMPRINSYFNEDMKRESIDQLDIIELFQAKGLDLSFNRKNRTKKSYQNKTQYNTILPIAKEPTVQSVREAIKKLNPTKKEYDFVNDEVIQSEIIDYSSNYDLLESLWSGISNRITQRHFEKDLNIELEPLSDIQILFIFYSILDMLPNNTYLADCIMDEVYNKIEE